MTIGADGLGLISYQSNTGALSGAHCRNAVCTIASLSTITAFGSDEDTSVTIGTDGLGLISYHDLDSGDLKVAHCTNTFCVPYFRRR